MCLSSGPSEYHSSLHSLIPCNVIYSVAYGNGTLYALLLSKQTAHATLERRIADLDGMFMQAGGDSTTRFTSVSDVMNGKVKTFGVGEHTGDEHFRTIFSSGTPGGGRELVARPGVVRWDPPLSAVALVGGVAAGGGRAIDLESRTHDLVDKRVMKLKTRISVYNRIFSANATKVAGFKLAADKSSVELATKNEELTAKV
jgi:hypothetical protein